MTDSTSAQLDAPDTVQMLCEKCRHRFPLDQFLADFEGMECVCVRCLRVMGYHLKGDL